LVREFAQELPEMAAPEAWQRAVQLTMEMPIDPMSELRVKAGKKPVELTAAHPFFWAGYLVVDSGWRPEEPAVGEVPAAGEVAAATGKAQAPVVPPQRPAPGAAQPQAGNAAAADGAAPPPVPQPPQAVSEKKPSAVKPTNK
jgi:hypothetical protein